LQIRDSTGARIMFPTDKDDDKEVITIVGKKESVEKAKAELEATIKEIVSKTLFYFLLLLMASVS
jgi:KH domain